MPVLGALFRQGDEFHGPVHLHGGLLVAGTPGAPYRIAHGPCCVPSGCGTPWQALGRGSLSLDLTDRGPDGSRSVDPDRAIVLLASGHRAAAATRLLRRVAFRLSSWTVFTNIRPGKTVDVAYSGIPLPDRSARALVHTLARDGRVLSVIDLRSLADPPDRALERICTHSGINYLPSLARAADTLLAAASRP
jgi:hypothetical protein